MQPSRILLGHVGRRILLESFIDMVHKCQCQHHPRPCHIPATDTSHSDLADLRLSEKRISHNDWTLCKVSQLHISLCIQANILQRIIGLGDTLLYHWRGCEEQRYIERQSCSCNPVRSGSQRWYHLRLFASYATTTSPDDAQILLRHARLVRHGPHT